MVVGGDAGPDEAVKSDEVQNSLIWLFNEHQFDVVHGRNSSTKNGVGNSIERRMITSSKAIACISCITGTQIWKAFKKWNGMR